MNSRLDMRWSRDTGQRIPCFDRCQFTITCVSNIKEGRYKPRAHICVHLLAGVWPPSYATQSSSCKRAYEQYR